MYFRVSRPYLGSACASCANHNSLLFIRFVFSDALRLNKYLFVQFSPFLLCSPLWSQYQFELPIKCNHRQRSVRIDPRLILADQLRCWFSVGTTCECKGCIPSLAATIVIGIYLLTGGPYELGGSHEGLRQGTISESCVKNHRPGVETRDTPLFQG